LHKAPRAGPCCFQARSDLARTVAAASRRLISQRRTLGSFGSGITSLRDMSLRRTLGSFGSGITSLRDMSLRRSIAVENRNAFHMGGVGEHVDRSGLGATVAGLVDQKAGVARQGRGIATHVNDPLRR